MKLSLIALAISFASLNSFASGVCQKRATQEARESSSLRKLVYDVEEVPSAKSYLVSYKITLVDSLTQPRDIESVQVILMKSDCSTVSVIPQF